jgi:hypothetical protein
MSIFRFALLLFVFGLFAVPLLVGLRTGRMRSGVTRQHQPVQFWMSVSVTVLILAGLAGTAIYDLFAMKQGAN